MGKTLFLACITVVLAAPVNAADSERVPVSVSRAQFTSGIQEREPVDNLIELDGDSELVYFYTELNNMTDREVLHSWEYQGQVMSSIRFRVDGPRWRIWSNKTLTPERNGQWRVTVMDDAGNILIEKTLDYNLGDPALELTSIY